MWKEMCMQTTTRICREKKLKEKVNCIETKKTKTNKTKEIHHCCCTFALRSSMGNYIGLMPIDRLPY